MKKGKLSLISEKLVNYIYKDSSKKEKEIMTYGAKILFSTLGGYLLIFFVSSIYGVASLALTAAITAGIIRAFAGGVHASSFKGCAFLAAIIFSSLGLVVSYAGGYLTERLILLLLVGVFCLGSLIIYYYAPRDVEEKPIDSIYKRAKLKIISYIVFFILVLLNLILYLTIAADLYILASLLGISWQLFTLTPLAYKLFNRKQIKEVRADAN